MTTNYTDEQSERIIAAGLEAAEALRDRANRIDESREVQPERLIKARADAEQARTWAEIEEPWSEQWSAIPGYNTEGDVTAMLALPNITAKETFGARLAFDLLDAGDDHERLEEVKNHVFTMVGGDTGMLFLLFASALDTVASLVVPQLVAELEDRAGDYDVRVMLAEARHKAWNARIADLRGPHDDVSACKPVDGYDIGANALDADDEEYPR